MRQRTAANTMRCVRSRTPHRVAAWILTVAACLTYGCRYEMLKDAMARGVLMLIVVGMEAA